jgi:hypothetical protein
MSEDLLSPALWDLLLAGALRAFLVGAFVWILIMAVRDGVAIVGKVPLWHKTPLGKWLIRLVLQPGLGALLLCLDALAGSHPWEQTSWVIEVSVGALAGVQAEVWHQWFGRAFDRLRTAIGATPPHQE